MDVSPQNCADVSAAEYYLAHPGEIEPTSFAENEDDKAVEYCIAHGYCELKEFSFNSNDIAVEWLIQHPQFIHMGKFAINENEKAADYVMKHGDDVEKDCVQYLRTL